MAANTANLLDAASALDLNNIRKSLQRMEDSIIFSLIERAQYPVNARVYEPDCDQLEPYKLHQLKCAGSNGCLGDWFIYHTECLHSQVRRYQHPTEFSFFGPLPDATLGNTNSFAKKQKVADPILSPVPPEAKINSKLLDIYRTQIIPHICENGDDGNYGSTALQDVHVLQTISTRIYYGLFVAESKFRSETEKATALIKAKDRDGLMAFITKPEVEQRNIQRVVLKTRTFSQDISKGEAGQMVPNESDGTHYKLDPEFVGTVFRDFLMPLTKEVEVEYLLKRLE
eukprot:CAMPEP_0169090554 /NCGR_PEP_ID=MMETSP1015-20121227/15883_1 /TAXON_ID=342587 /ORGANISM="Karlodinium micrum, Strain CCMP2283" /LENGTH=284 /DNA_ID=CAMNT_0009150971 /DNA_START=25 /DNA_END=879 /DNA_ORIENTATION=-